jgi:hypothetical protein
MRQRIFILLAIALLANGTAACKGSGNVSYSYPSGGNGGP